MVKRTRTDIMKNSVTFLSTSKLKYTNFKTGQTKVKIRSALFLTDPV